jgi:hypothetical protein
MKALVEYDAGGYPTQVVIRRSFDEVEHALTWENQRLSEVMVEHTVFGEGGSETTTGVATFGHSGDNLAVMEFADRTDFFEYDSEDRITRWYTLSEPRGMVTWDTHFEYDEWGRLVSIEVDDAAVQHIEYAYDGCPVRSEQGNSTFVYSSSDGRLTGHGFDDGHADELHGVGYDEERRILSFDGVGDAFQAIVYEPGSARGLNLFPSLFLGGFVYGFPAHGEVFRLDGRCDPSLPRETIAALALASLSDRNVFMFFF